MKTIRTKPTVKWEDERLRENETENDDFSMYLFYVEANNM